MNGHGAATQLHAALMKMVAAYSPIAHALGNDCTPAQEEAALEARKLLGLPTTMEELKTKLTFTRV